MRTSISHAGPADRRAVRLRARRWSSMPGAPALADPSLAVYYGQRHLAEIKFSPAAFFCASLGPHVLCDLAGLVGYACRSPGRLDAGQSGCGHRASRGMAQAP